MNKVIVDISMSLDGYVTARGADGEHGLGIGGEVIHGWAISGTTDADARILDEAVEATGAVVVGRRLFDVVDGPHGWDGDRGYGAKRDQSNPPPFFVVTHQAPTTVRLSADFTFVTDGIAAAVERAKAVAGEKDEVVMGGASVCDQAVAAGLVDRIHIHLAPVLLGGGTRLFDRLSTGAVRMEIAKVVETPRATHLFYDVNP